MDAARKIRGMSTSNPRRPRLTLPAWLFAPRLSEFARRKGPTGRPVADRIMVTLTVDQRRGLDRILSAAKRERRPLGEPDIVRVSLDRLIADVEREQPEPEALAGPAESES